MNEPAKQPLDLPAATYEPRLSASIDLERGLSSEVLLHVFDLSGTHEVKTCYGDVVKIVNALRDYARLLELVCDEWDLGGFHRATYEYQAEKLRQIADKLQCGIGYDYDAAVRKCQKLRGKSPPTMTWERMLWFLLSNAALSRRRQKPTSLLHPVRMMIRK